MQFFVNETIYVVGNRAFNESTKHVAVDCHSICECVMNQKISTPFTSSSNQMDDVFTKALGKKQLSELCD